MMSTPKMNPGSLHDVIKKRSDSLNLLFKEALVDYANKLWKYEIITDAAYENVLDTTKGGKEDRASSLCKALYNTVKVAEFPKQKIHMTHFLDTLEDVGGTETAAVLRKDLADLGIHILPRYSVQVSDHKNFHSEPANPAVMGYNQGIGYEVPFVNESQIGRSSQSTMPVNRDLPTTPPNIVLPISQHPLKNNSAPNLLQHEILTGKTNAPQRQVYPSPQGYQNSGAMQIPSESFQKFPIRESTDDSNRKAVEAFQGSGDQVLDIEEYRKVTRRISSMSSLETDFVCNQYIYFRDKCQQQQEELTSIWKTAAEQQKLDEEKQRAQYFQLFEAEKHQEMRDNKLKKQENILREEEKRLKEQEQQQHRRQKEKENALSEREKQLQVQQNQQQQESIALTKKKVTLQDQERQQEQETKRLTKREEILVERESILEERVKQQDKREKDTEVMLGELKKRLDQMITIQQEQNGKDQILLERERILIDQSSSQERRGKHLEERENRLDERVKQFDKQKGEQEKQLKQDKQKLDKHKNEQDERDKRQEDRDRRLASQLKEKQLEGKTYMYSWLIHFSLLIVILVLLIYTSEITAFGRHFTRSS